MAISDGSVYKHKVLVYTDLTTEWLPWWQTS